MRHSVARLTPYLALTTILLLSACNGGESPTSSTPPRASQAQITVTAANPVLSFGTTLNYRETFTLNIQETAGVGASINFIRLEPREFGAVVERQEIGSSTIIQQTGSNRIEANSSRSASVFIEFNDGNATDLLLTIGFTDDRGNNLASTFTITF